MSNTEDKIRYRENQRRKRMGLPPIYKNPKEPTNNYTVILDIPYPKVEVPRGYTENDIVSETMDRIAGRIQTLMKKEWGKISSKPFIIITEPGNKVKGQPLFHMEVELTQLNLDPETMEMFKTVCEKIYEDNKGFLDFQK